LCAEAGEEVDDEGRVDVDESSNGWIDLEGKKAEIQSCEADLVLPKVHLAELFAHQHHGEEVAAGTAELGISFDAHQAVLKKHLHHAVIELVVIVHLPHEGQNLLLSQFSNFLRDERREKSQINSQNLTNVSPGPLEARIPVFFRVVPFSFIRPAFGLINQDSQWREHSWTGGSLIGVSSLISRGVCVRVETLSADFLREFIEKARKTFSRFFSRLSRSRLD
jgi:hypothetical protein